MKKILLLPDDLHLDLVHLAKSYNTTFCDVVRTILQVHVDGLKYKGTFPPNRPKVYVKQKRTYKPKREEF